MTLHDAHFPISPNIKSHVRGFRENSVTIRHASLQGAITARLARPRSFPEIACPKSRDYAALRWGSGSADQTDIKSAGCTNENK